MTPFEALRASPLLREFTDVGVRLLAEATTPRSVGRGAYAFRGGDPSRALIFVASGTLQLLPRDGGAPLAEAGPGETLGGLSLLGEHEEHLLAARAVTDVELAELPVAGFEKLSARSPRVCLKLTLALARDLAARLHEARGPLREFLAWHVSRRQGDGR